MNKLLICQKSCQGYQSSSSKYKHYIVELSTTQWNRWKANSILVEDIVVDSSTNNQSLIFYNKVSYGNNIRKPKRRQCKSLGKQLHYKEPAIANIDGGFFFTFPTPPPSHPLKFL